MESKIDAGMEPTKARWFGLQQRIQHSWFTALDVLQILAFDAVILIVGNVIVQLTAKFAADSDIFFHVAKKLAHGLFVLLYAIVVCFHMAEFFKEQRRPSNPEK